MRQPQLKKFGTTGDWRKVCRKSSRLPLNTWIMPGHLCICSCTRLQVYFAVAYLILIYVLKNSSHFIHSNLRKHNNAQAIQCVLWCFSTDKMIMQHKIEWCNFIWILIPYKFDTKIDVSNLIRKEMWSTSNPNLRGCWMNISSKTLFAWLENFYAYFCVYLCVCVCLYCIVWKTLLLPNLIHVMQWINIFFNVSIQILLNVWIM